MAAPTPYARLKSFVDYAISHPDAPFNAADLDAELNALLRTVAGLIANRTLIQRDDGALANDSVHPDSLSTATLLLIEAAGNAGGLRNLVRGYWTDSTAYARGDIVQYLTTSYVCAADHVSSSFFDADYIVGKRWIVLGETAGAGAAALSFSPSGNISAVTVQTAIEELDAEKAPNAGRGGQTFLVGDATAQAHAVPMGQLQRNTLKSAIATGTPDAIRATIASGLTTLTDGMEFVIEVPGSNTITTPTLNLTLGTTETGAKTIVKGNNLPLVAGDMASNKCIFCYDVSLDRWVLLNPSYQIGATALDMTAGTPTNLALFVGVGANAMSATVITAAGSTPTASNPVRVPIRADNKGLGTYNVRTLTKPVGLTISAGSTLGHVSGVAAEIHWYLIDNAGELELAASSTFLGISGLASTTAEGGAGAADSYYLLYSATARTNVPFTWIGMSVDTQTVAGTWASAPTEITLVTERLINGVVTQNTLAPNVATTGPAFSVNNNTPQPLTSGVTVKVVFGNEEVDVGSCFSGSRFTPNVPGYYRFDWTVNMTGTPIFIGFAELYRNGNPYWRGNQLNLTSGTTATVLTGVGSCLVYLNGTTDYVEIFAHAQGTAPLNAGMNRFSGCLVRAAA